MRTTLTLDPDVSKLLKEETHRQRKPFKVVVNEALRRGLAPAARELGLEPFAVRPHHSTLQPGIDAGALNKLVDELEDEALVDELRGRS